MDQAAARLGQLLAARRGQIGYGARRRKEFAAIAGLSDRTIARLESGERLPSKPEALGQIEAAYELKPGSLLRTLAGAPIEPLARDRFEAVILDSDLAPADKAAAIRTWRNREREMLADLGICEERA